MKITALLFIILFTLSPLTAQALNIDLSKIKPLSEIDYLPEDEFAEQTVLVEETPYNDSGLSYRLRLPKNWSDNQEPPKELLEDSLTQSVLGRVSIYRSPPRQYLRSFLTVEIVELTYEIGARNWFINYVISNSYTLEQVGQDKNDQVEAIYVEIQGDLTYVVRVKAIKNGDRMVFVRYYVPQELYNEERVQQAQIIKSFDLTSRKDGPIEETKTHGFLGQSFFDYPVSWTKSAPMIKSVNYMHAMLYQYKNAEKLDGQINIYLAQKLEVKSRSAAIQYYQDKFQIESYDINAYLGDADLKYHADMVLGQTQIYSLKPKSIKKIDYEMWFTFMEGPEYYYIVTLLSPARHEEFYTWAKNEAAYRFVIENIRENDDNINIYEFIQ